MGAGGMNAHGTGFVSELRRLGRATIIGNEKFDNASKTPKGLRPT